MPKNIEQTMVVTYVQRIEEETYAHSNAPRCPVPHQVRLIGNRCGRLDLLPVSKTTDILGHGLTFEESAKDAWQKKYGNK